VSSSYSYACGEARAGAQKDAAEAFALNAAYADGVVKVVIDCR
jgi:hypothetical protein